MEGKFKKNHYLCNVNMFPLDVQKYLEYYFNYTGLHNNFEICSEGLKKNLGQERKLSLKAFQKRSFGVFKLRFKKLHSHIAKINVEFWLY